MSERWRRRVINLLARLLARLFGHEDLSLLHAVARAEREEIETDRKLGL